MDTYRGFDYEKTASGHWEWTDEQARVHTGKVNTQGGYQTDTEVMDAIDAYRREKRAAAQ